jgi:hypothetical protein
MSWSWAEIAFGRTRLQSRTVHWEEIGKRIARAIATAVQCKPNVDSCYFPY